MAIDTPARDVLSQVEAQERARRVSNVAYELAFDLERGSVTYGGEATIRFDLADRGEGDLFLDFTSDEISSVEINGATVDIDRTEHRLTLPARALEAQNVVRIVYRNEYDHTGEGFHQFTDPEDGEEYLYSDFEPFHAHKLFPCFDQPDLKASYDLTVTAPGEWQVTGNSRATGAEDLPDGRRRHRFERTVPFSTYLMALIAGPYHVATDEHDGIPLGIWCRRSLVQHLDTEEIFTVTKQGFDCFTDYFDQPYAFTKYDQIFVPEFNSGAMENVGAVTFTESYIFRDPPTETQRRDRAETVLHELAHMWFGDLATMQWWDDLWLNESFATYMSYVAMADATRFSDAWQSFSRLKRWAARLDDSRTTHPIAGQAGDTEVAFLIFDGITYGKGAAALQQLVAHIGTDGFREGIRLYFRRHAFGNATLAQFLGALGEGSGRDLGEWARLWLETSQMNILRAAWGTDGGRIAELRLLQSAPPQHPTLRPHTVEVGLVREEGGQLVVETLPATIESESALVPAAVGVPAPVLVYPNHNDHTYAKVVLDPESAAFASANMLRIADPMLRQLLWSSLWGMVRDQQFSSLAYLRLAHDALPAEMDLEVLDFAKDTVERAIRAYVPEEMIDREAHAWFETCLAALHGAQPGERQLVWARMTIAAAATPDDVRAAMRIVDGEERIAGLDIDQEMRWSVALRAAGYGLDADRSRLRAETERDPSDRGQRRAVAVEVAYPDAAGKAEAWRRFHDQGYGSWAMTGAALQGFTWRAQRELLAPYVDRFFEEVGRVFRERDQRFAVAYATALYPEYLADAGILARTEQLIESEGDRQPSLPRKLRELADDLSRAIACRAYASAEAPL